jgi:peroxisomal membrane protein 2
LAQKITHHQKEEERKEDNCEDQATPFQVDVAQVSRFALLNVAFVAPVLHHWYQFINRSVPGTSMSRVLQRTFWDEFVFSPMYIPVFLGMLWKLEGSSNENIVKMTKSEVPSIIVVEWITWVPTMIVTFRYCPVKFQVLVINVVGVAWQTFLAYMASNAHGKETAEDVVEKVNERDEDGFIQRALPIIATTSSAAEGGGAIRHAADCVATDENATAADCSCVDDESQQHISSSVIVEKKVIPLVLNTLLRRNTPKYVELEYCSMEDEYQ